MPHAKIISRCSSFFLLALCASVIALGLFLVTAPVALAQEGEGGYDGSTDYTSPDDCAGCHPDAYHNWEEGNHAGSLTNPVFIDAWSRAGEPTYCQQCHATGYDAVEGGADYEGVGCLACHDFATETGVPHMTIDRSSEMCGECHTGIHAPDYDEWLVSDHAVMNIECGDCHMSHTTDLRLENPEELCVSCHEMEAEATVHGQEGMSCHDCHMAEGDEVVDQISQRKSGPGHTFTIPSDVCAECHGMTHEITASAAGTDEHIITQEDLATCEESVEEEANNKLNLGLTGGGIGGLLIGASIPLLVRRRKEQ